MGCIRLKSYGTIQRVFLRLQASIEHIRIDSFVLRDNIDKILKGALCSTLVGFLGHGWEERRRIEYRIVLHFDAMCLVAKVLQYDSIRLEGKQKWRT